MVYISSGALQNTSTTPSFARDFKLAQEPRIFAERACCRAPVFSQAQQSLEGPKIYGASSKICKTITIYICRYISWKPRKNLQRNSSFLQQILAWQQQQPALRMSSRSRKRAIMEGLPPSRISVPGSRSPVVFSHPVDQWKNHHVIPWFPLHGPYGPRWVF